MTLEFWFEYASTYSYIAAMQIEDRCRAAGVALVWKPFLLGPIFALQGWETSHFNLNERRGAYMWRDVERLCAKYGYPWRKPAVFPKPTTFAARVTCALVEEPWCGAFIRDVYRASFGQDADISDPAVVARLLTPYVADPAAVIARSQEEPLRGRLRQNTERASALGIFGAPNCVVGEELFWGEEALEDAIAWVKSRNAGGAATQWTAPIPMQAGLPPRP